jgi:hypothetical protein
LQYKLAAQQAEMAYAAGHFGQALAAAAETLPMAASDWETEEELKLIQARALIRMGRLPQGTDVAAGVIAEMERSKLAGDAAYARLSTAEALLAAAAPAPAFEWASDSLAFFEPRQIWEAIVRAQLVEAQASRDSVETDKHILSARAAFDQLKRLWPAAALEGYRNRPDFERLTRGITL